MQCLLLHAENGCKRLKREFSPFWVQNVLKRAVSLFWVQKAEKGVFPLSGSKTCSRVEFRCFGVQNVLKSGVSLFWGPKRAQEWSFVVLWSKGCSTGQFRSFGLRTQHSANLGQQDISAPVSSVFEALGTVSCGLE